MRFGAAKFAEGHVILFVVFFCARNQNKKTSDGVDYVVFQQTVTSGLAALAVAYPNATLDLQGMVWMQGESDATTLLCSTTRFKRPNINHLGLFYAFVKCPKRLSLCVSAFRRGASHE
ncbi:MAG: hypothetical protein ABS34_00955 [Opitutaceae bacterium BACL24 MAG-120322-bin51]|nr:MAG: hypothetical protein ABS34_00955 [Opitutaceae bacterium BACL24 MAG-120322-bin51]